MKKGIKNVLMVVSVTALTGLMTIAPVLADEVIRAPMKAEIVNETVTNSQTAKISLEAAILKVKANFEIPQSFSNFSSGYSSYDGRQIWSLTWNDPDEGGSLSAQVDAENGDILNVSTWQPSDNRQSAGQEMTKEQARAAADVLVKRLLGERYDTLKFIEDSDQLVPLRDYGEKSFVFRWQRMHNGLPVIGDQVVVQVNARDGRISYYNLVWTKGELPDPGKAISQEQARKAFIDAPMLRLKYYQPSYFRPLAVGEKRDIKLVYELADINSTGAIDALTGKPLKLEGNQRIGVGNDSSVVAKERLSADSSALTPEEIKEIERNAQYISQDDAIAVVKKYVELPQGMILRHASLDKDWQTNERLWHFEWISGVQNSAKTISAKVNAITKELWSFNVYDPTRGGNKDQVVSREEARQIGEKFLQTVQPVRFKQVQQGAEPPVTILEDRLVQTGTANVTEPLTFHYERVVNGLPFANNYMTVTVDPVSRQVIGYNLCWGEYNFPAIAGILSMDAAVDSYLQSRPLTLSYIKVYEDGKPATLKLVYVPFSLTGMPSTHIIDAKTGKPLSWNGEPLPEDPKPLQFTDISGDKAEREIAKLGLAGAFREYGTEFRPNEPVTLSSLLRASLIAYHGPYGYVHQSDAEIIKAAKQLGWLKEDFKGSDEVSRAYLATVMVRMLKFEPVAQLSGIYTLPYDDVKDVDPKVIGYLAIADGLKLIDVSSTALKPDEKVTRSEAAMAIVRVIEALDKFEK